MSPGGRIRFQGGLLHNELIDLPAFERELVVFGMQSIRALEDGQMSPEAWRHRYHLVQLESQEGLRWLEYHRQEA